jgi:hypothetical protein
LEKFSKEGFEIVKEQQREKNFQVFLAQLTERGICDFYLIAAQTLQDALEEEPDLQPAVWENEGWMATEEKVLKAQKWITIAGYNLFQHAKARKRLPDFVKGGALWKERNGSQCFSLERWNFWADRFEAIGKMEPLPGQLPGYTRSLLTQAAKRMRQIEDAASVNDSKKRKRAHDDGAKKKGKKNRNRAKARRTVQRTFSPKTDQRGDKGDHEKKKRLLL